MKNTIRQILKEDRQDKFVEYVVDDYMRGATIFRNFEDYESAGQMRDYGWDGEMLEFAYNNYEDYGFSEDPEDEDVYYHKDSEHQWDIDEVLQDMFYIFIEQKVKEGVFEETIDGWREWKDRWDIVVPVEGTKTHTHTWKYDCEYKSYKQMTTNTQIDEVLLSKYAVTKGDIYHKIIYKIGTEMIGLIRSEKKLCH
jgi:hypothetical protein